MLPSSLYNLSSLRVLGVSGNKLSGTLPPDLANTLPQLEKLDMYDNQFHGFIPPSLTNATGLQHIQLHENGFKGLIPRQLGTLQKLFWLTLYKNQLEAKNANEWSFLTDLTNCSNLRVLIVSHNNLSGMLPASIVNFSASLEWLTLNTGQQPDIWKHSYRNWKPGQPEYLHCHGPTEIVHRDLKPSNVLLDDDMTAYVADFRLARFLDHSAKNQTGSMFLRGSIGYVAPEYGIGGEISTQGDIYSYGILLLEMFTGRRPTDDAFKEGLDLHEFAAMAFPGQIMEIVDPHLLPRDIEEASSDIRSTNDLTEREQECLVSIFRIGLSCSKESPRDRMKMEDVSKEMHAIRERLLGRINR